MILTRIVKFTNLLFDSRPNATNNFFDWLMEDPKTRVSILIALIGIIGAIIGGFFSVVIWPLFKRALEILWDKIDASLLGRNFEHRYLNWLISQHQYLPMLPTTLVNVNETAPQELDEIYVSLSFLGDKNKQDVELGQALKENPLLVILGDPGAGKTTLLRFLALTFARARRGKPLARKGEEYVRERLKIHNAKIRIDLEYGYKGYPLPIFVYLNRLHDLTKWAEGRSLLDAIRDEWKSVDALRDFPERFFEEKMDDGECIFLFDAFDELGTEMARDEIARRIGTLAASAPKGNRFIVTSRIVGYKGQLTSYGFKVVTVQRLTWPLVAQLINKWYDSLNVRPLAEPLLQALRRNPRIYELAVNPMLLSLIAIVQYVRGLIPDRRHVLYDECVKIFRFAPRMVQQEYNQTLSGEEATVILRDIALAMHLMHLREIARSELQGTYIAKAVEKLPDSKAALLSPTEILKNIEERSQLLIERGINEYGQPVMAFSHLTFQEYLTSVAFIDMITERREDVVSEELLDKYQADHEWWEEVILLYAAQLNERQRKFFFARLYPEQSSHS